MSFVSREDYGSLRDIERLLRVPLQPAADIPGYVAPKEVAVPTHGRPRTGPRKNSDSNRPKDRFGTKNGPSRRSRRGPRSAVANR